MTIKKELQDAVVKTGRHKTLSSEGEDRPEEPWLCPSGQDERQVKMNDRDPSDTGPVV